MLNSDAVSDIQSYGIDVKNRELYLHGYIANTDDDPGVDYKMASTFYKNINSAIILQNASTQFADGGEFGFGAEIGISTDKLHVRGPVGSEHLTSFKYVVHGNGQVRP